LDPHWDQLRAVADLVKLTEGDLVPALDIERDPLPQPKGVDVRLDDLRDAAVITLPEPRSSREW
jgi:hypothetical protein